MNAGLEKTHAQQDHSEQIDGLLVEEAPESIKRRLEQRFSQTNASRLCEYITGLPLESPEVIERVIADRDVIRGKYGLPDRHARMNDPNWYENFLRELARKEGTEVVNKSSCGSFFDDYFAAAAFFSDNKRVAVDIDKSTSDTYIDTLSSLEHEVIHALQHNRTPSMPVEAEEYEAVIAGGKVELFRTMPELLEDVLNYKIGAAAAMHYKALSEGTDRQIVPKWSNAEYFIREVDKIDIDSLSEQDRLVFETLKRQELDKSEE